MDRINWIGLYSLYCKEVKRFAKVYNQTLIAPAVTALLFLAVFALALGSKMKYVGEVPFLEFMASGLIMMSVVQNAFANTSSSLTMGKVMGTIVDFLMPPISPGEMITALALGGLTRGVAVGLLVAIVIYPFVELEIHHLGAMIFYLFAASLMLSLLGILAGVISDSFDQMSAITSYVITPLAFLSGTFYSVQNLPEFWQRVSHFDPFFYMIDGFRYGMTGHHDGSLAIGASILIIINILLWSAIYYMIKKGYKIKS